MNARLMICIPCHNRKRIVEQCVPTVRIGMSVEDRLYCYNDGSREYHGEWLEQWADLAPESYMPRGIEEQRRIHFKDFWEGYQGGGNLTHLYLADSDALHDPRWRETALRLQAQAGGAPVCLYNTRAHADIPGNTIEDNPACDFLWRRYAPGISYLLTSEHVGRVMKHIDQMVSWDWQVCDWLGNRMAISRTSYVDHIGEGGIHHPAGAGLNGGDVALHPTTLLQEARRRVVAALEDKHVST